MVFGEQRLVGAVEWTQQGRSFEGARINAPPLGPLELDLFAMKLQERSSLKELGRLADNASWAFLMLNAESEGERR